MDKVSIITICFNCKDSIETTLNSVVQQTYAQKEYIVIDGGSTDGTLDILQKYKDKIDILISEPDDGIYDALNKGIRKAHGEWINCMNAGDRFTDNNVLQNIFSSDIPETTSVLYSDYWLKMLDGGIVHGTTDRSTGVILHQSCIYRRSLHDTYGFYVVTHPYIISDLLFLLSIPQNQFLKVPYEISTNDSGGVSQQGIWAVEEAESAKVVYRIQSIHKAYREYWKQKIIRSIPYNLRRFVRKYILKKKR